jgi:hypothetical protein
VKEKVMCLDYFCVAQAALEAVLEKIGIGAKMVQTDNVKELAELVNNDFEEYTFYPYNTNTLKITIYNVKYDVIECQLESCEGYLSVEFEVSSDDSNIKEVIRKLFRDIGADVKICE